RHAYPRRRTGAAASAGKGLARPHPRPAARGVAGEERLRATPAPPEPPPRPGPAASAGKGLARPHPRPAARGVADEERLRARRGPQVPLPRHAHAALERRDRVGGPGARTLAGGGRT